jgi:amidase
MQEINRVGRSNLHYTFNKHLEPVASVESGSIVVFECVDCYSNQIADNNTLFADVNSDLNNPATGPLYVEGAEPGDVLKVKIQKITLADYGVMTARPGAGLYGDLLSEYKSKVIKIKDHKAYFSDEIILDLLPMIGVIGTAPNEETLSTWPGEHGGNIDIKDLREGSTIYLPVNVSGALLSMGDLHGIQGDGETVICALEMNGEVQVQVEVLKKRHDIPTPFIVTDDLYITTFAAKSLDQATKVAAHKMHNFLCEHSKLTVSECAMLLSLVGNLRVSQVVNELVGGLMDFPRDLVGEDVDL